MSRTFLSRSQLVLMCAVATVALGVTAASANGLNGIDVSTSYGGGQSGDKTKAWTHGSGSSAGASAVNAGGGLGYSQTGYAAGISGCGIGVDTSANAILWGGNGFRRCVSWGQHCVNRPNVAGST